MSNKKHNYQKYQSPLDRKAKNAEKLHRRQVLETARLNNFVEEDDDLMDEVLDDNYDIENLD